MSSTSSPGYNGHKEDISKDFLKKILQFKDALFSMAQVLTLDNEKSIQLVEKAVLRALSNSRSDQIEIQDRRYLLQLLIEVHQEESQKNNSLFAQETNGALTANESIKNQLIQDSLKGIMPLAFASLSDNDRALLILCEIERLSSTDASLIMGSDSKSVSTRLEEIKYQLVDKIRQNAPPSLNQLITQVPQNTWLPSAIQNALKSNYKLAPNTLESRIRTAVSKRTHSNPVELLSKERPPFRKEVKSHMPVRELLLRRVITLFLILAAGLAGYIGSEMLRTPPDPDLISLSVKQAKRIKPILSTSNREEAEDFIVNHLDWRLSLPEITGSTIEGVGISEITHGIRVPVFLYRNEQSQQREKVTLYAFTYALLDEFQSQIQLSADILDAIAEPDYIDTRMLRSGNNVFVWRSANDIFLAVTDEEELKGRIQIQ